MLNAPMEPSTGHGYERMKRNSADDEDFNFNPPSGRLARLRKILSFQHGELNAAKTCRLNYKEAAVYLWEGENNESLNAHPQNVTKLKSYFLARSAVLNGCVLLSCVALMALALFELPGQPIVDIGAQATVSIELCLLAVFVLEMIFKMQSVGGRNCVRDARFVTKCVVILMMLVEAVVFLYGHFDLRLCRSLRPLLLLDCNLLRGSRRFVRQLLETVPRVGLMLTLISFIVLVFSIIAFYMFHTIPKYTYFDSLYNSFLSLTVLLTLANFPDVILPAYYASRWYSAFFVIFMIIEVYIMLNFVLAGVYEEFTQIEKEKIKSLFLHRRRACEFAFRKLVNKYDACHMSVHNYEALMSCYKPSMSKRDILLSYKALSKHDGKLTIDKFYNVYEVADMKWSQKCEGHRIVWYATIRNEHLRRSFGVLEAVVSSVYFFWTVNFVLLIDATLITIRATVFHDLPQPSLVLTYVLPLLLAFIYAIEIASRVAVSGRQFLTSSWNIYDFSLVLAICITLPVEIILTWAPYACTLRLLRLLRLLQCHALYRNFVVTLRIIAPRILSAAIVTLCIYYMFAIIGMACFANFNFSDCCQNTLVEEYYSKTGSRIGYYFLFNFQDILYAGMTLFTSMAVNDWFIIQEAFAIVAGSDWPAVYFLTFYFTMLVVLSMVIALIVDAFVFRIQCSRLKSEVDLSTNVQVSLSTFESEMCKQLDLGRKRKQSAQSARERSQACGASRFSLADSLEDIGCQSTPQLESGTDEAVVFVGERKRSPFDFSMQIYRMEVHKWSEEHEKNLNLPPPLSLPQATANRDNYHSAANVNVSSYPWSSDSVDVDGSLESIDAAKLASSVDTGMPSSASVETQLVQPSPTGECPLSFWSPPPAPLARNYSYTMPQSDEGRSFYDTYDGHR